MHVKGKRIYNKKKGTFFSNVHEKIQLIMLLCSDIYISQKYYYKSQPSVVRLG